MKYIFKLLAVLCTFACLVSCDTDFPTDNSAKLAEQQSRFLMQKHQFEIVGCNIYYNKKPLVLSSHIDEWVKIIGPYDRKVPLVNDIYVWDEIGLQLYSRRDKEQVMSMNFIINQHHDKYSSYERRLEMAEKLGGGVLIEDVKLIYSARPKQLFKRWYKLDGILMNENIDIKKLNKQRLDYHHANYDWQPGQEIKTFHESYINIRYVYEQNCPSGQNYGFILKLLPEDMKKAMKFIIGD